MGRGINHIEFWVSDLQKSVTFYAGFLTLIGWKQTREQSFATQNLEIYFVERKGILKTDSLGIRHVCFQAENEQEVDNVYHFLLSQDVKVLRTPSYLDYSKGYYTVDFLDLDGQVVEVAFTPNMKFF